MNPNDPVSSTPEIVLRVIPMPADAGFENLVSGGWVMSKLDSAGSVLPMRIAKRRVALAAIEKLEFSAPILLGDIVTFKATVMKTGNTSITVCVEAATERRDGGGAIQVTRGILTYVAIDEQRRPVSVFQPGAISATTLSGSTARPR